jgi:hypothetical protein
LDKEYKYSDDHLTLVERKVVMGKGKRKRAKNAAQHAGFESHAADLLTKNFQKEIRNSEFWPKMVAEFGEEKAGQLLRECKGELKPGL